MTKIQNTDTSNDGENVDNSNFLCVSLVGLQNVTATLEEFDGFLQNTLFPYNSVFLLLRRNLFTERGEKLCVHT